MAIQKQFVFFFILMNIHGSLLSTFNATDEDSSVQILRKDYFNLDLVYKKASNNYVEFDKKIIYSHKECSGDKENEIPDDEIFDAESNIVGEFEKSIGNEFNSYIYNTLPVQEINKNNGDKRNETPEEETNDALLKEDYENHLVDVLMFLFENQHERFNIILNLITTLDYQSYYALLSDKKIKTLLKLIKEEDAKHAIKKYIARNIDFDSDLSFHDLAFDVHPNYPDFYDQECFSGSGDDEDDEDYARMLDSRQIKAKKLIENFKQGLINVLNREQILTLTEADNNVEANAENVVIMI